jgi:hypothetical protein
MSRAIRSFTALALFVGPVLNPRVSESAIVDILRIDSEWRAHLQDGENAIWVLRADASVDISGDDVESVLVRSTFATSDWLLCFRAGAPNSPWKLCSSLRAPKLRDIPLWLPSCAPDALSPSGMGALDSGPSDRDQNSLEKSWCCEPVAVVEAWLEVGGSVGAGAGVAGLTQVPIIGAAHRPADPVNVTTPLWHGLGNQMYSIYATIAYALRHGLEYHFSDSPTSIFGNHRFRATFFDTFFSALKNHTRADWNDEETIVVSADAWTGHYIPMPSPPIQLTRHITVNWQLGAFEHFDTEAVQITVLLGLPEKRLYAKVFLRNLFPAIPISSLIASMHFRIGDFKELNSADFRVLPYEFYHAAVSRLQHEVYPAPLEIIAFCEREDLRNVDVHVYALQLAFPSIVFHTIPGTISDWFQLLLMSTCDHHIIAQSSVSVCASCTRCPYNSHLLIILNACAVQLVGCIFASYL